MTNDNFKNPPKEYRMVPFWSWNDQLRADELLWQIQQMDEKGWGGFFMHSRKGLKTPYLSDEWMEDIRACTTFAKEREMGAWLYDEDKWPSGFCGGKIPKLGEEYRQKALLMREDQLELSKDQVELLKVYACQKISQKEYEHLEEINEMDAGKRKEEGYTILYFYKWTQPIGPNRFNDSAWVDLLNPKVTDAFLESTHEKYRQWMGDEFGKTIPGIFTDESTILYWAYAPKMALPWSEHFEAYFEEYNGYGIRENLPWLFFNLDGFEKIRYDYWKTVTFYFTRNYAKRIYEWCEKNQLAYTGHFMAEDYFEFTMQYIGSVMPLYEYMHIPGVDHLNRNINDIMTVKQVTSVAHQLGKERALCEMFGCSGQNFSFKEQKWIVDWNFVHGINLINPHLSLYSMRGERKRDYPPNLFYQQPWWEFNHQMADYCGRLSYMLTRGRRITDILLLHPIESAWCCYNPMDIVLEEEGQFDTPDTWIEYTPSRELKVNQLSYDFDELQKMLLESHYDYDLGDESIMENHGRVEKEGLWVGNQKYRLVIIPPCVTLRQNTLRLLQSFMEAGGKVIFIAPAPYLIDGAPDADGEIERFVHVSAVTKRDKGAVRDALEMLLEKRVKMEGAGNEKIWVHIRKEDRQLICFFANTDKDHGKKVLLSIHASGNVEELDTLTGERKDMPFYMEKGWTKIEHEFPPTGSLLLTVHEDEKAVLTAPPHDEIIDRSWDLNPQWKVAALHRNALTLDYCQLSLDGCNWSEAMPVHRAFDRVMKHKKDFWLRYSFHNKDWQRGKGMLVMESPEGFDVTLNGVNVSSRFGKAYWVDKSFKTAEIQDVIETGMNYLVLHSSFSSDSEVEAVYILGDFTVENQYNRSFSLTNPARKEWKGDLVYGGYPFYTGKMSFSQEWQLEHCKEDGGYFLEVDQQGSIVVEVVVNGSVAGSRIWDPWRYDITRYIHEGKNEIKIILTTSLHNLLGPHHSRKGEITACAPASFRDELNWTDSYHFVELGIRSVRILEGKRGKSGRF